MALQSMSVEKEFEKNPDLTKEALASLRDWVDKQPYLPNVPDLDLILFLHSCYWSVERAKHTIDTYYTIRTHVPEFFSHRDPTHPSIVNPMNTSNLFFLPKPLNNGDRVFYGVLKDTDASKFNFVETLKYFFHVNDIMLQECGTFNGFVLVMDVKGVTLGHVARLGPLTMKKFLTYLQDAMPVRMHGLHFINPVPFMDKIVALMKPFMKPDLVAMLHIHMQIESFYQYVDQRLMPKDFGGDEPSISELGDASIQKTKANKEFFLTEEKLRINENLRPGKAKNAGDLFGVEGSFKKLDID